MLGHLYTPKEALQVGMVHKLAPDADAAREECTKMLKQLMANDPWGVAESKKSLRYCRMHQFCFLKIFQDCFLIQEGPRGAVPLQPPGGHRLPRQDPHFARGQEEDRSVSRVHEEAKIVEHHLDEIY